MSLDPNRALEFEKPRHSVDRLSEDGELTTATSPVELLSTDGGVVNDGGYLDVILSALSGLIGC